MKEIKVGDYVRTKRGIAKVLEVKTVQPKMYGKHDVVYLIDKCPRMYISETAFIKHSKNIIDLIEVGDYVNGYKIIAKSDDGYIEILTEDIEQGELLEEQDIKTILTKELYQANCYTVERKEEC